MLRLELGRFGFGGGLGFDAMRQLYVGYDRGGLDLCRSARGWRLAGHDAQVIAAPRSGRPRLALLGSDQLGVQPNRQDVLASALLVCCIRPGG